MNFLQILGVCIFFLVCNAMENYNPDSHLKGRFSRKCEGSPFLPGKYEEFEPNILDQSKEFVLSLGADYERIGTTTTEPTDAAIQLEDSEQTAVLGTKYFRIKANTENGDQYFTAKTSLNPFAAYGYLRVKEKNDNASVFTIHQKVSDNAGKYWFRCVADCNGLKGYFLSYNFKKNELLQLTESEFSAGYVKIGPHGQLRFQDNPKWYVTKDGYIGTDELKKAKFSQRFTLEEVSTPKSYIAMKNGWLYSTNSKDSATVFAYEKKEKENDFLLYCKRNCDYTYGDNYYKNKRIFPASNGVGAFHMSEFMPFSGEVTFAMDKKGRIMAPRLSSAYQNYRWYYHTVGLKDPKDPYGDYVTNKVDALGQEFCVEEA